MENIFEVEIPVLLPDVDNEHDQCLARLERSMLDHKEITNAHIKSHDGKVLLCVHYDRTLISIDEVQQIARKAGTNISARYKHILIPIEGMDCSDCAITIEHSLSHIDGVIAVSVSYPGQLISVEYNSQKTSRKAIERRIRHLGYTTPTSKIHTWYQENREILFSSLAGTFLLIGWLSGYSNNIPTSFSLALYLASYILAGHDIARHALAALRYRRFDTDLLMLVAALGAAALGSFAEGALLLFLFSLGHALEDKALDRTRKAIHALAEFSPKTAIVRRGNSEIELGVDQVQVGDILIIRPSVRIPVDGVIEKGNSSIDQSPITGESIPVDKSPGDDVFSGSLNGNGALDIRASRLAKDSTLARVVDLVEKAKTQKSPTQLGIEKFLHYYVPVVLIFSMLLVIIPLFFGMPISESTLLGLTILVATSPCALALGTPATVLTGITRAARNGVLIKGGIHLENLGRMQALALDKTGTITLGKPKLTDIITLNAKTSDEVLSLAAAIESRSNHPLAMAIVHAADELGLNIPPIEGAYSTAGVGVEAQISGHLIWARDPKWVMKNNGIALSVLEKINTLEQDGKTVVLVGADQEPIGIIGLADQVRPGIGTIIKKLKSLGLKHLVILTGDNQYVASSVAKRIGLKDYQANLLPDDKLNAITDLLEEHQIVGMLGDGINDAPALAQSTVGIAMGGAGTDIALETADIALMADDLSKLPFAVGLGRATRSIIFQNLVISLGVIGILVILTLLGNTNMAGAVIFHEGSTLLVVFNALRLLRYPTQV